MMAERVYLPDLVGTNLPFVPGVYTVNTRPSASLWPNHLIIVSDASSGQEVQRSNGSTWVPVGGGGGSTDPLTPTWTLPTLVSGNTYSLPNPVNQYLLLWQKALILTENYHYTRSGTQFTLLGETSSGANDRAQPIIDQIAANNGNLTGILEALGYSGVAQNSNQPSSNIAYLATVSFSPTPSSAYPAASNIAMATAGDYSAALRITDGDRAYKALFDSGRYTGFQNSNVTITFDFGSGTQARINNAYIIGLLDSPNGIYRPVRAEVAHSSDNSSWTTVYDNNSLTEGLGSGTYIIEASFAPASNRYWRIRLTRSGSREWIFLSEVELWGNLE